MHFLVGDRVRLIRDFPDSNENLPAGSTGTVRSIRGVLIGIEFDFNFARGHNLSGALKSGCHRGWYVCAPDIELCEDADMQVDQEEFSALLSSFSVKDDEDGV